MRNLLFPVMVAGFVLALGLGWTSTSHAQDGAVTLENLQSGTWGDANCQFQFHRDGTYSWRLGMLSWGGAYSYSGSYLTLIGAGGTTNTIRLTWLDRPNGRIVVRFVSGYVIDNGIVPEGHREVWKRNP